MRLDRNLRLFGMMSLALTMLLFATTSVASDGQTSVLTEPAAVPAPMGTPAAAPMEEPSVAVGPELVICCNKPLITYQGDRPRFWKRFDPCQSPVSTVLLVQDPRGCCDCREKCSIEVPVCIPACCLAQPPRVASRCGILDRGFVTHDYCCGFRITILFRHRGDVVVRYSRY